MIKTKALHVSAALAGALALGSTAWADPDNSASAEDDSAEFQSDLERIAAERGVPAPSTTVTTKDGFTSVIAGVSAMKMLIVRQNEDGTLSYEHVTTNEEADAFIEAETTSEAAEE